MNDRLNAIVPHLGIILRPLLEGQGHILMFHRICPRNNLNRISLNAGMEVSPAQLEEIIAFFANRGYIFLSLDQMVDHLNTKSPRQKFVVFTFDDGYTDILEFAYPLLKKHNIPFTVYIPTYFPRRTAILWWYLLENLVLSQQQLEIQTGELQFSLPCRTPDQKEETFAKIRSLILAQSTKESRHHILQEIFLPFEKDLTKKTAEITLSWEQLRKLNSSPLVTLGAHTINHLVLSQLSLEDARNEILESKQELESHLGEEVRHFAYPFGGSEDAGPREFRLIKECGFKTAVTTRFSNISRKHRQHLDRLPRIFLDPASDFHFLNCVENGTATLLMNGFRQLFK